MTAILIATVWGTSVTTACSVTTKTTQSMYKSNDGDTVIMRHEYVGKTKKK